MAQISSYFNSGLVRNVMPSVWWLPLVKASIILHHIVLKYIMLHDIVLHSSRASAIRRAA